MRQARDSATVTVRDGRVVRYRRVIRLENDRIFVMFFERRERDFVFWMNGVDSEARLCVGSFGDVLGQFAPEMRTFIENLFTVENPTVESLRGLEYDQPFEIIFSGEKVA
jgi:hypothetical protein